MARRGFSAGAVDTGVLTLESYYLLRPQAEGLCLSIYEEYIPGLDDHIILASVDGKSLPRS